MPASLLPAYGLAAVLMLLLTLGACDGGGDGGGGPSLPEAWVTINEPQSLMVKASSINLNGSATCDTCPQSEASTPCPAVKPAPPSAINVTWRNRTTGSSGSANHYIDGRQKWFFNICYTEYTHVWWVNVPLMPGENLIEVTASGAGWASGTESITITQVPGIVGNLQAASGKQQVTLTWDPVLDATSYNIYRSTSRDVSKATGTMIVGVNSPYTQTGLMDGETYYYIVTAVVFGVEGEPSNVVSATPGWVVESVVTTSGAAFQVMPTSIATDSTGKAHIHYAYVGKTGAAYNFRSYYVTNATGAWAPLLVYQDSDSDMYGQPNTDIALDSQNTVHVSGLGFGALYHAIYASGVWPIKYVDFGYCGGSLALDPAGKAHIGYFGSGLRYATNTSGSWTSSLVVGNPYGCDDNGWVSLGVDAAGTAHIAHRGIDNSLSYATNQGGTWTVSVVDQAYIVRGISLAVDTRGGVHIVYVILNTSQTTLELRYAQNVSGTWTIETIASGDNYFSQLRYSSLSLDAAGKAHVSYYACHVSNYICDDGELRYASNSSGTWHFAAIEVDKDITSADIAVDSQGKAHITYSTLPRFDFVLRYATNK